MTAEPTRPDVEAALAHVIRDHDKPPDKDQRGYDYRMGWWDAIIHADRIIRGGIRFCEDCPGKPPTTLSEAAPVLDGPSFGDYWLPKDGHHACEPPGGFGGAAPEAEDGPCSACRATPEACMDMDGGCCDGCRSSGGCSHAPPPEAASGDCAAGCTRHATCRKPEVETPAERLHRVVAESEARLCGCDRIDLADDPHRHERDAVCDGWPVFREALEGVMRQRDEAYAQLDADPEAAGELIVDPKIEAECAARVSAAVEQARAEGAREALREAADDLPDWLRKNGMDPQSVAFVEANLRARADGGDA